MPKFDPDAQDARALFESNVKSAGEVLDEAVRLHRAAVAEHGDFDAMVKAYTGAGLIDPAAAATMLAVAIARLATAEP